MYIYNSKEEVKSLNHMLKIFFFFIKKYYFTSNVLRTNHSISYHIIDTQFISTYYLKQSLNYGHTFFLNMKKFFLHKIKSFLIF